MPHRVRRPRSPARRPVSWASARRDRTARHKFDGLPRSANSPSALSRPSWFGERLKSPAAICGSRNRPSAPGGRSWLASAAGADCLRRFAQDRCAFSRSRKENHRAKCSLSSPASGDDRMSCCEGPKGANPTPRRIWSDDECRRANISGRSDNHTSRRRALRAVYARSGAVEVSHVT